MLQRSQHHIAATSLLYLTWVWVHLPLLLRVRPAQHLGNLVKVVILEPNAVAGVEGHPVVEDINVATR